MVTRFETETDLKREIKAVKFFCSQYGFCYKKQGKNNFDFKIYNKQDEFLFNLEVKGRLKDVKYAYPLPIAIRKLLKLNDTKQLSTVLWCCNDGIIFSWLHRLNGNIKIGGRKPRPNSVNDIELMAYYEKCDSLIEKKFK